MPRKYPPVHERLWAKVRAAPNGCWEWTGAGTGRGYGHIKRRGKDKVLTHRLAFELATGRPVPDGLYVLHRCDNPPCCNPSHLFLGTPADNMHDKIAKGRLRVPRGSAHSNAKLTEADVREIRRLYKDGGVRQIDLAKRYGVGQNPIHKIIARKSWRHVS